MNQGLEELQKHYQKDQICFLQLENPENFKQKLWSLGTYELDKEIQTFSYQSHSIQ